MVQGNLTEAVRYFRDSLAIGNSLAATDPTNTKLQRDLSVLNERLGNSLLAQGELDAALAQFHASHNRMLPIRDAHLVGFQSASQIALSPIAQGPRLVGCSDCKS